jgi:hypothetical protein
MIGIKGDWGHMHALYSTLLIYTWLCMANASNPNASFLFDSPHHGPFLI